jgi:hypothetical protein
VRTELGIAGVTGLFVVAGLGILLACGLVELRARSLLAASGFAYLAGVAGTLLLGILLLVVGGELSIPVFVLLALGLGAGGAGLAWRRGRPAPSEQAPVSDRTSIAQKAVIGAAVALLGAVLVIGLLDAGARPLTEWDSWSIWTRKAAVLTSAGLDTNVFAGVPYAFSHLEYPILLPLFESVHFRAMGGLDTQAIHACIWIFYVASLGAIAYLASRFTRIWIWLPVVFALALGGQFQGQVLTAYADLPMALMAAPGILCLGLWLHGRDRRHLILATLLLGAAASIKNEGLLLVLACLAAAGIVLAAERSWRRLRVLALGAVGVVVAIAPWQIWIKAHDIKSSLPVGKGLDPSYLSDQSDRVGPTLKALLTQLESGGLLYVVPLAVTLAVLGVATRSIRPVAGFYLLAGLGALASIVWAFVITQDTLEYQIATSGNRVIMGVVFVSVAGLLHVGALLDAHRTVLATADRPGEAAGETPAPGATGGPVREATPA